MLVFVLFGAINPCRLLTKTDLPYVEAVRTRHSGGDAIDQCLFRMPNASESVTVEVNPLSLWQTLFGTEKSPIWKGNRTTGALYVRAKNAVLRISVGGGADVEEKAARAKKLGAKAVKRLPK